METREKGEFHSKFFLGSYTKGKRVEVFFFFFFSLLAHFVCQKREESSGLFERKVGSFNKRKEPEPSGFSFLLFLFFHSPCVQHSSLLNVVMNIMLKMILFH